MDNKMNKQSRVSEPRRKLNNADANGPDIMGLWFAALVLCAVLAAGVIVYQTGNSDIVTASNEATPAVTHGSAR
ncbi:MAG TPA: hypothetical protein VE396_02190 [Xanthobacteraceae bacterium]|jgi:hypothetical protein|nr:hypothetical protein [Xanthobacteraceae bacterium]